MKWLRSAVVTAMLCACASSARAANFDDAAGVVRLDGAAALAVSFDSEQGLANLPVRVLALQRTTDYVLFTASTDAPTFASDAVEGRGALRIPGTRAVLLGDQASLAPFSGKRIEITMFARADGALPELRAIYGDAPLTEDDLTFPLGRVIAFRTGRVTSDGWVELSTGPIDGAMTTTGVLRGLLLTSTIGGTAEGAWSADALEIHTWGGPLVSGGACSLAEEASACAKGAACVEGLCIDSAVVYGPMLPLETRKDIVSRVISSVTRVQEDRHAAANAAAGFAKDMPAVALNADTPMAFYRPLATSFGAARGAHSFAPSPDVSSRASAGAALTVRYYGGELNGCFGMVDKDLSGGGRGYGVYAVASPSPLVVGDVVTTIDGEAPDPWIARTSTELGLIASDPDSDAAFAATELHALIMRYGLELVVDRCAGGTCSPVTIDLAALRKAQITPATLTCSPRFQLAVDVPSGTDPNAYETAIAEASNGVMSLHTNGEPIGVTSWVTTVSGAFDSGLPMIVDKRRGDGGGGDPLETWGGYMRRASNIGIFFVERVDHAAIDGAPGVLDQLLSCDGKSADGNCGLVFFDGPAAKPGTLQKTAWLNVLDASASDMATFFAKGAGNVRIFAPNRTAGLFGSLGILGGFLPTWSGGSVQITDVRAGATPAERESGVFRSGTGIEPDEVVVQLQSDLLANRDTMLTRARAWVTQ